MKNVVEAPEVVGMSSERLARIKPVMQAHVDHHRFAGLSTMIARDGKVVHFEQVGHMDAEAHKPLQPDTIFRIYSMTKPIICVALMTLYEQGRFQLLDPVSKFIPAFGKVRVLVPGVVGETRQEDLVRPMTIRDLLTHTSGLTYDFLEDSPVCEMYRQARLAHDAGRTLQDMVSELARLPLAFQPGTRWHYSLGIDVAAHLVEMISGQPLGHFLSERLFAPLGMTDTAFYVPPEKYDRLAAMYGLPDLFAPHMAWSKLVEAWGAGYYQRLDVSTSYPMTAPDSFARGGHGLYSTAWDYMRFAQMLLNQGELDRARILGRKTVALMHMNHLPARLLPYELGGTLSEGYGFGLGSRVLLNVAESACPGSVGEFGWAGAAKTYYWVDPQERLVGLLMTQYMIGFDTPENDLRVLAYQALVD